MTDKERIAHRNRCRVIREKNRALGLCHCGGILHSGYKQCEKCRSRETPAQSKERNKRYRIKNIHKLNGKYGRDRRNKLKSVYGMTIEQFDQMEINQKGLCAICFGLPRTNKGLFIDHNHTSGKVRELLCDKCNSAIGFIKEDIKILDRMREYLIKHL